jgi:hypothetical protein
MRKCKLDFWKGNSGSLEMRFNGEICYTLCDILQGPPMTAIDKETGRIMGFVGDVWAELESRMNFR